jgi:hypothetical protein
MNAMTPGIAAVVLRSRRSALASARVLAVGWVGANALPPAAVSRDAAATSMREMRHGTGIRPDLSAYETRKNERGQRYMPAVKSW